MRIATMIDAGLISYRHYFLWADELIADLSDPPVWLLEIATIKYLADASAAIKRFVFADSLAPTESSENLDNMYVASLFHRFQIGAISWASFLEYSGGYTDAANATVDCEFFYYMLNELEASEYDPNVEYDQVQEVTAELASEISAIGEYLSVFQVYFRRYVKEFPGQ
ncbi:MAG: hypothetical protein HOL01_07250 [Planctomycetaceae bacterium]|jgi:hypothetical protein|nr:hypothetical protein [Planctomycetaceae bacterium]